MLWQVRALLPDRPGAMASLASRCGERGANILALDVHPTADGQVVDELVVHAPDDWAAADVEALCLEAGVDGSVVTACSAQALEDQPVRYLRAAQALVDRPDRLEELICRLLDATPAQAVDSADLLLDDEAGPLVALAREHPFTATEMARVAELRLLASASLGVSPNEVPAQPTGLPVGEVRAGTVVDTRALLELHERCSAETLSRRYGSPIRRLTARLAKQMLAPKEGFSLVIPGPDGDSIVAFGMVTFGSGMVEAAILVEDGWQRKGLGTRLLRGLAAGAADVGASELTLVTGRGSRAVLSTVRAAGFRAHVSSVDGVCQVRVPLRALFGTSRSPGRSARGRITKPLIDLLHERQELREIYAPADIIDRAIRDGV